MMSRTVPGQLATMKLWLLGVISVCVGSRCGRWPWSLGRALNDVISGQCVFKV